ncbi:MAG: DUF1538 domain-containing protein [Eubacteriales bacterium]|nr:DUF1538 domain-containing protein [Eubacteriales bacterium]
MKKFGEYKSKFLESTNEAFRAVLPVFLIILALSLFVAPIHSGTLLCFIFATALLILGSGLFNMGAELSMTPIGEKVGASIAKSRKLIIIIISGLLLGIAVTVAEPDLQVLAAQVPSIPSQLMIYGVAFGVGFFLMVAILRMFLKIPLNALLIGCYAIVFVLSFFVPNEYRAISFDAGGVTTGPMTVPFIMALGVGVAMTRIDSRASEDSFGLVALCSIGPILVVMILGILPLTGITMQLAGYASNNARQVEDAAVYLAPVVPNVEFSVELVKLYIGNMPTYIVEMLTSLSPIVLTFIIFQLIALKLKKDQLARIILGLMLTYVGLVFFMTGVNIGFLPTGYYLGELIAAENKWVILPAAMIMGYACVKAEPAVAVLNKQVEEMTDGAINAKTMGTSLSVGVAISLGIAMIRVLTGISIMWFILPGYLIAIVISFFVPKIYTAIAFDSGGVASGPMTAAFLLPFAQGACSALGGNIATDAFGVVAMVAMTPLITIQILGLIARIKNERISRAAVETAEALEDAFDDVIVEL